MPAFTPQEIHFLFERAFNIGDVEAMLALYEPGAVLVVGGKPVTGHDGIRDAFNVFLSSGARMHRGSAPPTGRQLDVCHRQSEYAAVNRASRRLAGFPRVRLETTPQAESAHLAV
jgi:hypothetical protein